MIAKPPAGRRKFANAADNMNYLYDKLLYWLYERGDRTRACVFAKRLAPVLSRISPGHESIFAEECWSLIFEAKGDLRKAIKHRQAEIRLIRRLHEVSRSGPNEDLVFEQYGYDDLSDRLDLLAVLFHDNGNLDKAIDTLRESRKLCEKHEIPFDGEDILEEYLEEKKNSAALKNGKARRAV